MADDTVTVEQRAESWITHLAWVGNADDPSKIASEAASLMRELLDQIAAVRAEFDAACSCGAINRAYARRIHMAQVQAWIAKVTSGDGAS